MGTRSKEQILRLPASSALSSQPWPILHIYWWVGIWGLFIRQKEVYQQMPVDFYCKCFIRNKYLFSLKNKSGHFIRHREPYTQSLPTTLVIRASVIMMGWVCSKAESFVGLTMEGKVLQWKWDLSEFHCDQNVIAKGSVPSQNEVIAQLPIIPIPKPLPSP